MNDLTLWKIASRFSEIIDRAKLEALVAFRRRNLAGVCEAHRRLVQASSDFVLYATQDAEDSARENKKTEEVPQ
jgi:hypothetical protein